MTAIVSLFTIVFGELVPKAIALAHAERLAFLFAVPVELLGRLLAPLVWLLTTLTQAITRLFGVVDQQQERVTAEELMILVERGQRAGRHRGRGAADDRRGARAGRAARPRGDGSAHRHRGAAAHRDAGRDRSTPSSARATRASRSTRSRSTTSSASSTPRTCCPYLARDEQPDIRSILRTPLFVPESMTVDDLLHMFQRRKVHIAIVLDEYGGTAGLVTIEDLIEEIVGEIQDEYDVEEPMLVPLSETRRASTVGPAVDDLAEHFGIELERRRQGGVRHRRRAGVPPGGRRAQRGRRVEVDGLTLTVETTDGRRVGKVLVVRRRERRRGNRRSRGQVSRPRGPI